MKNGISRIRRTGVGVLAALTVTVGLIPLLAGSADAASNLTVRRFAGANRFDTARLIGAQIGSSPTVVIARGDLYPDALAGAYVAGLNNAAILLTRSDAVPAETSAALTALGATRIIILGGTTAVSTAAENQLRARPGTTVERISGPTRFETAVAAASQAGGASIGVLDGLKTAIIASGLNFPDAISGSPMAFAAKFPILLTSPTALTPVTRNALISLGIKQVLLLGGPAAVSESVENELKGASLQLAVTRLQGANRSGTSVEITKFGISKLGFTNRRVGLARGDDFADALTYAGLAGRSRPSPAPAAGASAAAADNGPNGVILSTSFNVLGEEALAFARSLQPTATETEIIGGPQAITPEVEAQWTDALRTNAGGATFTLSSSSVAPGGSLTGNATGDNMGAITVSGCGFNNTPVRTGAGSFTLGPFPATGQSCSLVFSILPANGVGATRTVTVPVTVTTGAAAFTIANSNPAPGGAVNGSVTGDNLGAITVSGCGLTNQAVRTGPGSFTFNIPASQPNGNCTLTFTSQPANGVGPAQTNTATLNVGGAASGPVTLNNTSGAQGSTITGTVANPSQVQSLSVSGCGLSNQNLPINASGGFSFAIPNSQTPGSCSLTFIIQKINGTSETQTIPFSVTATAQAATVAPDLVSASGNSTTDVVTYTFDQNPNGAIPAAGAAFHIYSASGTQFNGGLVTLSGATAIVQFPTGSVGTATVATVEHGTVQNATGQGNPVCAAALNTTTQVAGRTTGPDLISVGNFQLDPANTDLLADFVFDQAVATTGGSGQGFAPTFAAAVAAAPPSPARPVGTIAGFELVISDNTFRPGTNATPSTLTLPTAGANTGAVVVSSDAKTVRVNFGPVAGLPIGEIRRGLVEDNTVTSTGTPPVSNPLESVDVAGSGITVGPDLVSAAVSGANTVTYTYDEAVNPAPATLPLAAYTVYNAGGVPFNPTNVVRSNQVGGETVVIATFAPGIVGSAVGASVADAAATATDVSTAPAGPAEDASRPLQNLTAQSGRTSLPDLVSVQVIKDALGNPQAVYTFDQALPVDAGHTLAGPGGVPGQVIAPNLVDFILYDNQAAPFTPTGTGRISSDRTQVVFGIDTVTPVGAAPPYGGFTLAQATAAVIGAVNVGGPVAGAGAPPAPFYPEGCAPAQKSGF